MRIVSETIAKHAIKFFMIISVMVLSVVFFGKYIMQQYKLVRTEEVTFTESNKELDNPDRGFYLIYGVTPSDENRMYYLNVLERLQKDSRNLALIQINLRNYAEGMISESGMHHIKSLFAELEKLDKRYIVRFLYDWDGNCAETEPDDVEIVFGHMRQLEDIFREYEDIIFVHQGLFIGNWGEMNGTKHGNYVQRLALQLEAVTGESTFLAVRTPAQWRNLTGFYEVTEEERVKSALSRRFGLFNDGMLGNASDCGTYGTKSKAERGMYASWNRKEELEFQSELCVYVPNGGEVINNNELNDFKNAAEYFRTTHVSYLNWDYDREVLDKWKGITVRESGCFDGMDGLSYIERHLGYRLLIDSSKMKYDFWSERLWVTVNLKNVGFAPLYKEPEGYFAIRNKENGEITTYPVKASVRSLVGGNDNEIILPITEKIAMTEFREGEYEAFFYLMDVDSNRFIEFANEQEQTELGYLLGSFEVKPIGDIVQAMIESFRTNDKNKLLRKWQKEKNNVSEIVSNGSKT